MTYHLYQIDAFTSKLFGGNPAAIVPLEQWLTDQQMQALANENNLSETAFFVKEGGDYRLRWFTPVEEVDLCGHATLAAAYVIFNILGYAETTIRFQTRGGRLQVDKHENGAMRMDFPSQPPKQVKAPAELLMGLGVAPESVWRSQDYMAVFKDEAQIRALVPNHSSLARLDARGVMVTAPGAEVDFVSRFFAPKQGIAEDPVTGSAHCALAPYWAGRLRKNALTAKQLSPRGGELTCILNGDRVQLLGFAVHYMTGAFNLT